jgi:hypothetical protein
MTKRNHDLARRGSGSLAAGNGQATSSAGWLATARGGTVVHRVAPAQLAGVAADARHAARLADRPGGGGRDVLRQLRRLHLHRPAAAHPGRPGCRRDHAGAARVRPGRRGRQLHRGCSRRRGRVTGPARPGRRSHQLSASRPRRSGPRAGPGSAGTAGRRGRWSRNHRTTTTPKLPFAAMPATARKELPCPTTRKELPCPTRL